jgi:2-polyprenyl-3-methyl-5-hydroxy-6-metoxy-1,4-benzoquinol methylase
MINKRFDDAANSWDLKPDRLIMAEKFAREIQHIIKGKNYTSALDYGCGTGNVSFCLKDTFTKITLADASKGMLNEVENKIDQNAIKHFTPVLLDLEKQNHDAKYNVIYTLMALHHVHNVEKVINDFSKLLLPEGMLIIGDLEEEDGDFHRYPENEEVHFGFSKAYLEKVLGNNNLEMDSYNLFHNMERTHTGTIKSYNMFVMGSSLMSTC